MNTEKTWVLAVTIAPMLQAASGGSWLAVLITGTVCAILKTGVERYPVSSPGWLETLRWLWSILLLTEAMQWIGLWWPDRAPAVILLLLAVILTWEGGDRLKIAAGAMLWPILLLITPVTVAGIQEIRWEYLQPEWGRAVPGLVTVLLMPTEKGRKKTWIPALMAAVIVQGVLSVKGTTENPMLELGRSLSLFGTVKRFESLIAVGMTLGLFLYIGYLLQHNGKERKRIGAGAAAAAGLYLMGIEVEANLAAAGVVVLEVLIPVLLALKNYSGNLKKSVDK